MNLSQIFYLKKENKFMKIVAVSCLGFGDRLVGGVDSVSLQDESTGRYVSKCRNAMLIC